MPCLKRRAFIFTVFFLGASGNILALPIIYYGSSGNLAASASFELSGSILSIVLSNTSRSDVLVSADVLTGLGFNAAFQLSPISASLYPGSSVFYNSGIRVSNPGIGWGYGHGVNALGMNSAISSSGAITGLGHSNFSYPNSQPLQGLDFGILSLGDDPSTGNRGVTQKGPLFRNSLVFSLSGPSDFTLNDLGDTVLFFYGTSLAEPSLTGRKQEEVPGTPEPATFVLFGTGIILLLVFARRSRSRFKNPHK